MEQIKHDYIQHTLKCAWGAKELKDKQYYLMKL